MRRHFLTLQILLISFSISGQGTSEPGRRDHLGLAYDEMRNAIVLFGGNDINEGGKYIWNPSTWEWRNSNWTKVDANTPGPISSMSMCFDASGKQVIMMGGMNPEKGDLDETWIWNGEEWKQHQPSTPGVRMSAAMAYDYNNNEIVLFSGCVGREYPTDTWVFRDMKWVKVSDSGPKGVCRAAMFYDHVRESIILFGGALSRSGKTNEMWEWKENQWEIIDQGTNTPEVRANILMAYDEDRKKAVLYGGSGSEGILDDLWEWDGMKWEEIAKQPVWPDPLEVYGIVYHKQLQKTMLYGGRTGFAKPVGTFWSWDGKSWELFD